jgi:CHASE2 domain-containing sensor protein
LIPSVQLVALAAIAGQQGKIDLDDKLVANRPKNCWDDVIAPVLLTLGAQKFHLDRDAFSQRILYSFPWRLRDDEIRPEVKFGGSVTKLLNIVPAYTVTEGDREVSAPKGHIAVIGSSFRESRDIFETPLGAMPGGLILINAIHSLMQHGQLTAPPLWLQLLSGALLMVIVSAIFMRFSSMWGSILAMVAIVVMLVPLSMYFYRYGIWLDFALPVIAVKGFSMFEQYRVDKKSKRMLKEMK